MVEGDRVLEATLLFGYSAQLTTERDARSSKVGTVCWMAPELIKGERRYDTKIDIWSAGVVLLKVVLGYLNKRSTLFNVTDSKALVNVICE